MRTDSVNTFFYDYLCTVRTVAVFSANELAPAWLTDDEYLFDNSTSPGWKAKELRQACVHPPRMPAPTPTPRPHTLSRTPHAATVIFTRRMADTPLL